MKTRKYEVNCRIAVYVPSIPDKDKLIFAGEYTVPPPCSNLVENMSLLSIVANFNKC